MNGQVAPPGQHYAMDYNPQLSPERYDGPFPQSLMQSPLGLPSALLLQPMMQAAASEIGYVPGQLAGTQNYLDNMRGMRYQQHGMRAQSGLARADIRNSADVFAGAGQLAGIFGHDFRKKKDKKSIAQQEHFASLMETMENNADLIMMADMALPGVDIMDTLTAHKGGSTATLGAYMQMANKNTIDPTTGKRGLSGESIRQRTEAIQEEVYGGFADASAGDRALMKQRVHGLKLGKIGEGIAEFSRRGLGPTSISSQLDQEEIAGLREASFRPESRRPSELRSYSGDDDVSDTDFAKLSDLIEKNGGDIDVALRKFDAQKTADWAEKMSGIVSAMGDIFGPGQSIDQMLTQLDQLTQNSTANKSLGEVENIARQLKSGMTSSGMGWQQTAKLTAFAADLREQGGGQREDAYRSTLHSQAFSAAYDEAGRGANEGLSWAGMSRSELMAANTALHTGAATSPVNNQLGMIVRMSEIGEGFEEGSEMDLRAKAIKEGKDEYEGEDGKTRSVYSRDFSELTKHIERDSDGNITSAAASQMILQNRRNTDAGGGTTEDLTRGMQKELDVIPAMAAGIRNVMLGTSADDATAEELIDMAIEFKTLSAEDAVNELEQSWDTWKGPDGKLLTDKQRATRLDNLRDEGGEIDIHKANEAVLKKRIADHLQLKDTNLTDAKAAVQADNIYGKMDDAARARLGKDIGVNTLGQLYSAGAIKTTNEARKDQVIDAKARDALAGIGGEGLMEKISTAIAKVGAGEGRGLEDVFAAVIGQDPTEILALAENADEKVRASIYEQFEVEGDKRTGKEVLEAAAAKKKKAPEKWAEEAAEHATAKAKKAVDKRKESERSAGNAAFKKVARSLDSTWKDVEAAAQKTTGLRIHSRENQTRYWEDGKSITRDDYNAAVKKMRDKPAAAKKKTEDAANDKEALDEVKEAARSDGLLGLLDKGSDWLASFLPGDEEEKKVSDTAPPSGNTKAGGEGSSSGGAEGMEITGTLKVDIETGEGVLAGKGSTGGQKDHTTP